MFPICSSQEAIQACSLWLRVSHAELANRDAKVLAISMDSPEVLRKFKADLKAPFAFVSDEQGKLVKAYDVKAAVLSFAQRYTFVVGEGRKILSVTSGKDAVDPSAAVAACPPRKAADGGH